MVTTVTVTFSRPVTLRAGSLRLVDSKGRPVEGRVTNPSKDGRTFVIRPGAAGRSLPDGSYTFVVNGSRVSDRSGAAAVASQTFRFHRLFGDFDGDGHLGPLDRDVFRSAYGKTVSASQLWYADYNGNGLVDAADLFQFNQRRRRH